MDRRLNDYERFSRDETHPVPRAPEPALETAAKVEGPADDGGTAIFKIIGFALVGLFGYFVISSLSVPGSVREAFERGREMNPAIPPPPPTYSVASRDIQEVARALAGPSVAAKTTASMNQGRVGVTIDIDPIAFASLTRRTFWGHVQAMVPEIFNRFPEAQIVRVTGEAVLRDIRGNDTRGPAIWLEFSRQDASRVNWKNVLRENLPVVATAQWSVQAFK